MISKINLVPKEVNQIRKIGQTLSYLKVISRGVAVGLAIIVVLEYLWVFRVQSQLTRTQEQISSLESALQEQFPVEIKYLQDQKILQQASSIMSKRKDYQSVLSSLYGLIPAGSSLDTLSFSNRVLLISTKSKDVQVLANLISNIQNYTKVDNKVFGDVAMTSNHRIESGEYNSTLELELLNPI